MNALEFSLIHLPLTLSIISIHWNGSHCPGKVLCSKMYYLNHYIDLNVYEQPPTGLCYAFLHHWHYICLLLMWKWVQITHIISFALHLLTIAVMPESVLNGGTFPFIIISLGIFLKHCVVSMLCHINFFLLYSCCFISFSLF